MREREKDLFALERAKARKRKSSSTLSECKQEKKSSSTLSECRQEKVLLDFERLPARESPPRL